MTTPPSKTSAQLLEEADTLIKEIWTNIEDPENLSKNILKLSILNAGLGNCLAEAMEFSREAEAELKYQREKIKLEVMEKGQTAAKAESMKITSTIDSAREVQLLEKLTTLVKLKRDSIDKVIEAARSRLAVIRSDIRNVN